MGKLFVFRNSKDLDQYFACLAKHFEHHIESLCYLEDAGLEELVEELKNPQNLVAAESDHLLKLAPFAANLFLIQGPGELSRELLLKDSSLEGVIDARSDWTLAVPMMRQFFYRNQLLSQNKELAQMGQGLGRLMEVTLSQLKRIKKLHEQLVPLRQDDLKGIKLFSKFSAGESPGGEFYDVVRGEGQFVFLLTSSTSYVVSSIVLSHFEKLRGQSTFSKSDLEGFLSGLAAELKDLGISSGKSSGSLQTLLLKIDQKKLTGEGYHFGGTEVISDGEHFFSGNDYPVHKKFFARAHFDFTLKRGEKLAVISPGVRKNSYGLIDGVDLITFVKENMDSGPRKLLDELFMALKKIHPGEFLAYDASLIFLEVDQNVIVQV
ncbi:MAG: hypothetical protein HN509_03870 [Halobacteriovoraceae bacterium]|jgi:hypothetical protein|nr:hypothetical protein [Halobacteriovoraceae bacterium]MBT5093006.1 hypothetical protein [Halobacteriovoraceae bacterium]